MTQTSTKISSYKRYLTEILGLADISVNGTRPWDIQVHDQRFYARVIKDGSIGLGESYMAGWWDVASLDQMVFKILRAKLQNKVKPSLGIAWSIFRAKLLNLQDRKGSMVVIDQHYQLGNDLYLNMLGKSMTYSCAYWKNASNLDEAQLAKYDLIARKLGIQKGMKVLDIGCGWGGFAKYIAENYGSEVVAVTLSENQASYAKETVRGLPVEIRVQDYRDVNEKFDRVVSIGMFEHVGYKNYSTFMRKVYDCLNEGQFALIHTIGSNDDLPIAEPWTNKYIFPGGALPSVSSIGKAIEGLFSMEDWHNLNVDYDRTLLAWFQNFHENWEKLQANYPDPFYRMWKYYLLSFAAGFRARSMQLWQIVLSKDGAVGGYQSIR